MLVSFIFALTISAWIASVNATPTIRCGETPRQIYSCIGYPQIIKHEASRTCTANTECERMICVFTNSGWLNDGKIDKEKVMAYYDQFAAKNPQWSQAVHDAKKDCVVDNLPPQGVYLNCPAYDVMLCSLRKFIKNVQLTQWSSKAECQYSKQFATMCPVCPSECFSPFVPFGSCNSCLP